MSSVSIERDVVSLRAAGQLALATTRVLHRFGPELLGLLMARCQARTPAWDRFTVVCEDIWRALPEYAEDGSLRTWCYCRLRAVELGPRKPARQRAELPELVTTEIDSHRGLLQQEPAELELDPFARLRCRLAPDDELLLLLRVARGFSWIDVARVMVVQEGLSDPERLRLAASQLRERYAGVKNQLKRWAEEEGLLLGRS